MEDVCCQVKMNVGEKIEEKEKITWRREFLAGFVALARLEMAVPDRPAKIIYCSKKYQETSHLSLPFLFYRGYQSPPLLRCI